MEITQTESLESLNDVANQWLYLASLFNMIEMVIAKSDPKISAQYESHLVPKALWPLGKELRGSFIKTKECLLKILGDTELLINNPILDRSISVRNPYLLALHLLQIELLERYRAENSEINQSVEHALLVSISGIAAGMHNTG
jgi:phosphoenolpyruvate carboxylase